MTEEIPCANGHVIDKVTPAPTDLYFANRVCDCSKLIFVLEPCGCPNDKHDELRSRPNPNYNGQ
jgi:hypothetical protein